MNEFIKAIDDKLPSIEDEPRGDNTTYDYYNVAFQFLCAVRKIVNPELFEKNESFNQDDLNDKAIPLVMQAMFISSDIKRRD